METTLKTGNSRTFEVLNCVEGYKVPFQHIVTLKLIQLEKKDDELAAYVSLSYEGKRKEDLTFHQSFLVEGTDLPLIDNIPLRMGARMALVKKGGAGNTSATFSLVTFTQEIASVRDKLTTREYIEFLEKSDPFNKDGQKDSCVPGNKPLEVKEITPSATATFKLQPSPYALIPEPLSVWALQSSLYTTPVIERVSETRVHH
jgi:hypothetical protein